MEGNPQPPPLEASTPAEPAQVVQAPITEATIQPEPPMENIMREPLTKINPDAIQPNPDEEGLNRIYGPEDRIQPSDAALRLLDEARGAVTFAEKVQGILNLDPQQKDELEKTLLKYLKQTLKKKD